MPAIRALTVCVGPFYAATLEICLVRNMRHFVETFVVTAPGDEAVKAVAGRVPGVTVFETDAFYRHGAKFNKGLSIEECFDFMGRHGMLCIIDADILLPDSLPLDSLDPNALHGASRRTLLKPERWHPGFDWKEAIPEKDGGPVGFFQLFNASAPAIRDRRPWYEPTYAHCGGGDDWFMRHWPKGLWKILPVEVLHLGPRDRHWFGTDAHAIDQMSVFVHRNGWQRAARQHDPSALRRVSDLTERVEVPGVAPTGHELPFVKRAQPRPRPLPPSPGGHNTA